MSRFYQLLDKHTLSFPCALLNLPCVVFSSELLSSATLRRLSEAVYGNLLRSPEIDFQPGGIDFLSIHVLFKRLKIRALVDRDESKLKDLDNK
jgi:hypothetical protein